MNKQYTVKEVLEIIKTQLETIPVSGESVRTMASVFTNLDALIEIFTPVEKKEPKKE